jgi:hypothetical protein
MFRQQELIQLLNNLYIARKRFLGFNEHNHHFGDGRLLQGLSLVEKIIDEC